MINFNLNSNNTDKFSGGVGFSSHGHNYQLLYKNFIKTDIPKILEIGTAYGGFAKFLKNNSVKSFLVGADINPNENREQHVTDFTNYNNLFNDFYVGDCFKQDFIDWLQSKNYLFDLVVEDGPHTVESQCYMIAQSNKFLSSGGVYICEDIQSYEYATSIINSVPQEYKKYAYIWDARNSIGRFDDMCVVIDLR